MRGKLQIVQDPPLKHHGVGELSPQPIFREALAKFEERLLQHRFRQDQFPDQIEHAVDFFRIHPQQVVGAARPAGRRRRFRSGGNVVSVVHRETGSVAGSGRGGRRQRGLVRAFSGAAFGSGGENLRKRRQRRWDAQGLDLCIQRNGGDVALGPYLLHRFFRHQRRFDLFYGIETVFRRIEGQHLAQFRQRQLDHLASGDGHSTLRVDLHYHVMNALPHRHRAGHRQLFVFRPAASLRGGFLFLLRGFARPVPRRVCQSGNVRPQRLDAG
jgi:hypothetical protein